jgi:hypothetical protein
LCAVVDDIDQQCPRLEIILEGVHVMARGNQGLDIFRDDKDRRRSLKTLAEALPNPAAIPQWSMPVGNENENLTWLLN